MKTVNVTISVDADVCSATGSCVAIASELFELNPGEDVARVLINPVESADLLEQAREAAECCPLAAIELSGDEG